ncbi:hypothetical protein BUALT_Bualt02G0146900 [Buddleja alternifolia]|uniref:GTD-binding domain-containing protein n=1 Tax=Buddleja alternifolia TaxID=168488 RepID=A0AAV6YB27_9LAMI|nr:hypothetical protein BUALT_Bualt02G0146900 [Buddleja alternifolia]
MPEISFKSLIEQKLGKFPHFLIYAILEWIMIILLFLDAFLAFFSNQFAKFFDLTTPCLLCTRIDHALFHRNSNFYYNNSICEVHKKDISSLAYCSVHKKLSNIRSMCQGCLLSFATEKDSDCHKYKSFVGILHKDVDFENDRALPLKKDDHIEHSHDDLPRCSCCGETLQARSSSKHKPSLTISVASPRASWLASRNEEGRNIELPPVRYTEIKISDNETEVQEEDASNVNNQGRADIKAAIAPSLPDPEDINEDTNRTPIFARGNKFFGIPLDSAQVSPRWFSRGTRKLDLIVDPNDIATTGPNEADSDVLNRLKRQVRLDHKTLTALYMELDEERSASATAANNAMAMITRLQAEKAAVQMEALQYQRMMEEQSEYDEEAMQVMKDMLFKKDEDMKVLELELETYREKYGQIKNVGSEICEVDGEEDYQDIRSRSLSSFSEKSESGSSIGAEQNDNERRSMEYGGGINLGELSLDFEGERSYLLRLLTDLEKKVNASSYEGSNSSEVDLIEHQDKERGSKNKGNLTREVSSIRERLRAIEADSGILKHAAMTLQRGGDDGTKLLTEIAQHLRKLRRSLKSSSEDNNNT